MERKEKKAFKETISKYMKIQYKDWKILKEAY